MLAFECLARFILVLAGSQGGKTVLGPYWLAQEIARCSDVSTIAEGETDDYLAASANYDILQLKMLPALRLLFETQMGWTYHGGNIRMFTHPSGKIRILLRSAESEGGLESATIKAAWLDEWGLQSVGIQCWEAVQRRLAIHRGRALITTTPYCMNWLKVCVYDRAKGGDPDYALVQFANIDNPAYPREEYDRLKRTLPNWKFRMFCHGEMTRPAGLIYSDYEDGYAVFEEIEGIPGPGKYINGGNLIRAFSIPPTWLRVLGVDFGESANCGRLWSAEDPATHYHYIYRDALGGGLNGPEYAREALNYGEPIRDALGGSKSEDERRIQWAQAGLSVREPAIFEVEAGIDHGNGIFKQRRVFVLDTCTRLRSELGSYSRELDAAGEPTQKIADKQKFHMADAWRYLASSIPMNAPPFTLPQYVTPPNSRAIGSLAGIVKRNQRRETEEYL